MLCEGSADARKFPVASHQEEQKEVSSGPSPKTPKRSEPTSTQAHDAAAVVGSSSEPPATEVAEADAPCDAESVPTDVSDVDSLADEEADLALDSLFGEHADEDIFAPLLDSLHTVRGEQVELASSDAVAGLESALAEATVFANAQEVVEPLLEEAVEVEVAEELFPEPLLAEPDVRAPAPAPAPPVPAPAAPVNRPPPAPGPRDSADVVVDVRNFQVAKSPLLLCQKDVLSGELQQPCPWAVQAHSELCGRQESSSRQTIGSACLVSCSGVLGPHFVAQRRKESRTEAAPCEQTCC